MQLPRRRRCGELNGVSFFRRDELGVPTFWPLQTAGWSAYYVFGILSLLPNLSLRPVCLGSVFVLMMFGISSVLRFSCRDLMRRTTSWIGLEARAFGVSLLAGTLGGCIFSAWSDGRWVPDWSDALPTAMQVTISLFLWCSLYLSIKQWQLASRERQRLLSAETEAREARLSVLRYQLNPHLLFNSLNAVSTLVLEGNGVGARRMLSRIAELLRTILDGEAGPETTLAREIALTRQYLAIEQVRLGARLHVDLSISPETLDVLVPTMLLQPLVENAVRHGIAPIVQGGVIRIDSRRNQDHLQINVRNSGPVHEGSPDTRGVGVGLVNTAARLRTLYAADHHFSLRWPADGGCAVTLEVPFRKAAANADEPECVS
jgi:two-component system LytT family sensor kinase